MNAEYLSLFIIVYVRPKVRIKNLQDVILVILSAY